MPIEGVGRGIFDFVCTSNKVKLIFLATAHQANTGNPEERIIIYKAQVQMYNIITQTTRTDSLLIIT